MGFTDDLKAFLEGCQPITREEADAGIELIKGHLTSSYRADLRARGLCLNCQDIEIDYGRLSHLHRSKGDGWLDGLIDKWKYPPKIEINWKKVKINEYQWQTVSHYICGNCVDEINELIERQARRNQEQSAAAKQQEHADCIAKVEGRMRATDAGRYWALMKIVNPEWSEQLLQMRYKQFLQSHYWSVIRGYVVYKRGRRCEMCAAESNFNVHHKTYEHHGYEHKHLDDLILLCRNCHAKFHDKLAHVDE